jgi:hypothetical protein
MKRQSWWVKVGCLLGLAAALLASACSTSSAADARLGGLSEGCVVNSDCEGKLVCTFQRCHVECVTTRDCDGKLRCVGAKEPERVCQLELESSCATSADCPVGLSCSQDAQCRDVCSSDAQCIGLQTCVKGVCAEPSELDEQGQLPQVSSSRDCRLNSDCPSGWLCARGSCLTECRSDRDCGGGQECEAGACRSLEPESPCACREDVDCRPGQSCDGCACHDPTPECQDATDCDDDMQCSSGSCARRCVEDRDCLAGQSCTAWICGARVVKVIPDAIIDEPVDLAQMHGVEQVTGTLMFSSGSIKTTLGLESLESVGRLELSNVNLVDSKAGIALAGLANLKSIGGDMVLVYASFPALRFNPELRIDGNVVMANVPFTCAEIFAFVDQLSKLGGTVDAQGTDGACVRPAN